MVCVALCTSHSEQMLRNRSVKHRQAGDFSLWKCVFAKTRNTLNARKAPWTWHPEPHHPSNGRRWKAPWSAKTTRRFSAPLPSLSPMSPSGSLRYDGCCATSVGCQDLLCRVCDGKCPLSNQGKSKDISSGATHGKQTYLLWDAPARTASAG